MAINAAVTAALLAEIHALLSVQVARAVAISTATTVVLLKTQSESPETDLTEVAALVAEDVASAIDAMNPADEIDYVTAGKFVGQQFCDSVAKKARDLRHG